MKHGKNCGFFAPQKSIRWRSELVFGLKESLLAQLSRWSAKWHQDSLQVSENVGNFSKVNEAAAAYMVIAEGPKWLTKFSAWCCWAYDLTYALDDRTCRRKITRLADSSERPTPGLSVFLLFVWASMCSVWNDTNVWNQNQWVAFVRWVQSKVKTCDHSSFQPLALTENHSYWNIPHPRRTFNHAEEIPNTHQIKYFESNNAFVLLSSQPQIYYFLLIKGWNKNLLRSWSFIYHVKNTKSTKTIGFKHYMMSLIYKLS